MLKACLPCNIAYKNILPHSVVISQSEICVGYSGYLARLTQWNPSNYKTDTIGKLNFVHLYNYNAGVLNSGFFK